MSFERRFFPISTIASSKHMTGIEVMDPFALYFAILTIYIFLFRSPLILEEESGLLGHRGIQFTEHFLGGRLGAGAGCWGGFAPVQTVQFCLNCFCWDLGSSLDTGCVIILCFLVIIKNNHPREHFRE